jgi:hypothetical protein
LRPFKARKNKEEMTNADKIAVVLVEAAANGSLPHALAVMDRVEGKPAQEQTLNINDIRDIREWSREELDREIAATTAALAREQAPPARNGKPHRVH